jgi:hypothetical protein
MTSCRDLARKGAFGRRAAVVLVAAGLASAVPAGAGVPTVGECLEGADFITNAAIARDNGISRRVFVERLEEDLTLIHAFPVELRWFAKDEDDERFLHASVEVVFDAPASPEDHRARFLLACFERLAL